eukprot:3911773-Amphidinium_carterae.3
MAPACHRWSQSCAPMTPKVKIETPDFGAVSLSASMPKFSYSFPLRSVLAGSPAQDGHSFTSGCM